MTDKWGDLYSSERGGAPEDQQATERPSAAFDGHRRWPRLRVGVLSVSLGVLVVVALVAWATLSKYQFPEPPSVLAAPVADSAAADASNSVGGAAPAASAAMPANFTGDQLTAAFAVEYGANSIQTDRSGSRLVLDPRQLLPVNDKVVALISEGVRDGGRCTACKGVLRIDYLNWTGSGFARPQPGFRFEAPGSDKGAPPAWTVHTETTSPTIGIETTTTTDVCVATRYQVDQLTATGVNHVTEQHHDECAAPAPPVDDGADNDIQTPDANPQD